MNTSLAEFVWERAGQCCEYCRMPQVYDELPFEIDHVVAEQHGGKTIASNLALACFADNHHKGPNLAGIDPKTRKRMWLFNPRRHRWARTSGGTGRSWSAAPPSAALPSTCSESTWFIASGSERSLLPKASSRLRSPHNRLGFRRRWT
jgi:hypothetical protein